MNEKKQSGKKRLFLLVLVAFGIVLWITFTNLNRIALRHTLDETIGFVKIRLEQYETDAANDRVKSLVRLLDKTVSLGNEMTIIECPIFFQTGRVCLFWIVNDIVSSGTAAGKIPRTMRSLCFSRHLRCS